MGGITNGKRKMERIYAEISQRASRSKQERLRQMEKSTQFASERLCARILYETKGKERKWRRLATRLWFSARNIKLRFPTRKKTNPLMIAMDIARYEIVHAFLPKAAFLKMQAFTNPHGRETRKWSIGSPFREPRFTRRGKRLAHCENRIYDVDNELPRKRGLFYFCEIFENNMWG